MNYFGASINTSSVVAETTGADMENTAFCAVKYDENGNVILCDTEGEIVAGVVLPDQKQIQNCLLMRMLQYKSRI